MRFVKRTDDLLRTLRRICKDVLGKQEIMAGWIGKNRTTFNKKLQGLIPFTYPEVVAISEQLRMPDLVRRTSEPKILPDVAGQRLNELFRRLSLEDRRELYSAIALMLDGKLRDDDEGTRLLFEEFKQIAAGIGRQAHRRKM